MHTIGPVPSDMANLRIMDIGMGDDYNLFTHQATTLCD